MMWHRSLPDDFWNRGAGPVLENLDSALRYFLSLLMPFSQRRTGFDPATLETLQEAFDLAWPEIAELPIVSSDPEAARELLAQRIIAAAQEGQTNDPEQLKVRALRTFEV